MPPLPTFQREAALLQSGCRAVAGVDEAGRGPLAGPVVAAAVVLPPSPAPWHTLLRDSKTLSRPARQRALTALVENGVPMGVGASEVEEIDRLGIGEATRLAMYRALERLPLDVDHVLVDYVARFQWRCRATAIVDGDALCTSIAAASIVAKETRDRLLEDLDLQFPGYGFARHKGYGVPEHFEALRRLGPCPAHRRSFEPVRALIEGGQGVLIPDGAPSLRQAEGGALRHAQDGT